MGADDLGAALVRTCQRDERRPPGSRRSGVVLARSARDGIDPATVVSAACRCPAVASIDQVVSLLGLP